MLSVAVGVAYWGWTFFYEISKPALKLVGLNYLASGFWLFIGIFLPLIIRKPFVAVAASVIAAGVEGFITHWGLMSTVWGLAQGLGAGLIFMLFGYRKWNLKVLSLATITSATFSYALDYYYYDYAQLPLALRLTQYLSFVVSGLIFATYLSYYLADRLNRLNLLGRFLISKNPHD